MNGATVTTAEADRHQMLNELSWNAEEIAFIRLLGERLEYVTMYPEPPGQLVASTLDPLRRVVHAASLVYIPNSGDNIQCAARPAPCIVAGEQLLSESQLHQLAVSRADRIIDNDLPAASDLSMDPRVRSVAVINVGNFHCALGYLMAINCSHPDNFGTRESSLLRTIAALLTMYAMNYRDRPEHEMEFSEPM